MTSLLIKPFFFHPTAHAWLQRMRKQLRRMNRINRDEMLSRPKAVLTEAAVGIRTIPARITIAWRAVFSQLDTVDKLDLLSLAGRDP